VYCFIESIEAVSGFVPITVMNCEKLTGLYYVVLWFF